MLLCQKFTLCKCLKIKNIDIMETIEKIFSPHQIIDPIAIGNRIKSARMLSGHTRKSFAAKSSISLATLRFWEEPKSGRYGLTNKGAEKLMTAFNICGIYCTKEWLFYGHGIGPKLINLTPPTFFDDQDINVWNEEESILKDIEAFKKNNPQPTIVIITDDTMLPSYSYGDYVAGSKVFNNDIQKLVGLNCIIELIDRTIVRKIIASTSENKYSLLSLNQNSTINQPLLLEIEPISAAEIVFHRWRKKSY